jgi:acyl-CoA synthetase (NDP forming)
MAQETLNSTYENLDFLFHPRSLALVGITTTQREHWTRGLLEGLLTFQYDGQLYLVNPKGGEIEGHKVYPSLKDVPPPLDYVIGLVPAPAAPGLVRDCAGKGVHAMHFCTAGFSETGEEEGIRLEAELVAEARQHNIRVLGPNCLGIYYPKSRLSFSPIFPRESGVVGFISQSGGNSNYLVRQAALRGVRFSKGISYGNACDLNEADFLEYLAVDPETKIIAMYIEGLKDGKRFRRALEVATKEKVVVLLKGGLTEGGARAVAGHTAALAGSKVTWEALCQQLGIIRVESLDELVDVLVTLLFLPVPKGRNVALIGAGGGASVLITDEFEKRGLKVPGLPEEITRQIREFTPAAGNILRNPVDYSQSMMNIPNLKRTVDIVSRWDGVDFLVDFMRIGQSPRLGTFSVGWVLATAGASKPTAVVLEPSLTPEEASEILSGIEKCAAAHLPVYYSFTSAANAINLVLNYYESRKSRART